MRKIVAYITGIAGTSTSYIQHPKFLRNLETIIQQKGKSITRISLVSYGHY